MNAVARVTGTAGARPLQTAEYPRPGDAAALAPAFFSDEELDSVLSAPLGASHDVAPPEVSQEARVLARVLGSQYAEVIAHYAVDALMGRNSRHAPKLRQIVKSFKKLATEMNDRELLVLYEELGELIESFTTSHTHEQRLLASRKLREWVMAFADLVGDEAGLKLRRLVVYRKGVHPLISHLREIRGIGDKRLERLYTAGLLTTETLVDADPNELAQIVGIPTRLARQVVEACRRFAEHQRHVVVAALKSAAADLTQSLGEVDFDDDDQVRLVAEVRAAMQKLDAKLSETEAKWTHKARGR
ncbi:MAG: helix-hairpin-helix domain-containing protein [Myxococcota bacterium]